jgi:hypothetical protein
MVCMISYMITTRVPHRQIRNGNYAPWVTTESFQCIDCSAWMEFLFPIRCRTNDKD